MILILPIDQNDGLAFNQRRQSRDKILCQRVLELAGGKPLLMHPRSARLFLDFDAPLLIADDRFLAHARRGEYCFAEACFLPEDSPLLPRMEEAEKIILFRWDCVYPADVFLPRPLAELGWRLTAAREFAGSSHELITEEVYER
ncbi:MAG: ribonuclease Z [Firmicutes bacterium]|nr:ribonuclease Z [Bacillota bacterium]